MKTFQMPHKAHVKLVAEFNWVSDSWFVSLQNLRWQIGAAEDQLPVDRQTRFGLPTK